MWFYVIEGTTLDGQEVYLMKRKLSLGLLVLATLSLLSLPSDAHAAEFTGGGEVLVRQGEVVDDDLYASGGAVTVYGTINGDLIATGGSITVSGTVNGDVAIAGGTLVIEGTVADDIRAAGGTITVNSNVGGDVVAAGGTIAIGPNARIGNDLVTGAGSVDIKGTVEGDVKIGGGAATIDGVVMGDVSGEIGETLTIGPNARIAGDLTYTSAREADIQEGAVIDGETVREVPMVSVFGLEMEDSPVVRFVRDVLGRAKWFIGTVLIGLLLMLALPETVRGVSETPRNSPWKTVGLGVAVLIAGPIVILVVAVLAILLVGAPAIPVLLAPGAAYLVLLMLAAPVVAVAVGNLAMSRDIYYYTSWKALLIGAAILAVIGVVPYLAAVVTIITILVGFGAWLLFLYRGYIHARMRQMV
jgi:cytoskeletal protein CcmA (bactofilin family)